ncbi:MAG: type II toxin-antitoxin system death-on-curing family toxin [Patescibacteria group bacterium]
MIKYISVGQVVAIHDSLVKQFGGSHGIRSKELLESAVFRMQASFDGIDLYQDIFEKAAALFESLCKNHPFVDGNKRTAFTATATFLEVNGYNTEFDQNEAEKFTIAIASGKEKLELIAKFLKKNSKKAES